VPIAIDRIRKSIENGEYVPPVFLKLQKYIMIEALAVAQEYIDGVLTNSDYSYVEKDGKYQVLGISGMKGIGKSELLKQIGTIVTKKFKNFKSVYITFSGGGTYRDDLLSYLRNSPTGRYDAFGQLLLKLCNVDIQLFSQLNFKQCLTEFRSILQMTSNDVLLILIDEIGSFVPPHDSTLLSSLMSNMEQEKGKLIFIFAHIKQQFLKNASPGSGRPVKIIPLTSLEIDIWKNDKTLEVAATKFPSIHQLLLSCSGHPRSLFDSLYIAIRRIPDLLTEATDPTVIAKARDIIIQNSQFTDFVVVFFRCREYCSIYG
jgi:hypothetical protein